MNFKKIENESLLMFSEVPVTSRVFDIPGDEWNPGRKSFASQANKRKIACHSKNRCFFRILYMIRFLEIFVDEYLKSKRGIFSTKIFC